MFICGLYFFALHTRKKGEENRISITNCWDWRGCDVSDVGRGSIFTKRINGDIQDGDGNTQNQACGVQHTVLRFGVRFGGISLHLHVQSKLAEYIGYLHMDNVHIGIKIMIKWDSYIILIKSKTWIINAEITKQNLQVSKLSHDSWTRSCLSWKLNKIRKIYKICLHIEQICHKRKM